MSSPSDPGRFVLPPPVPPALPVSGSAGQVFAVRRIFCVGRNYADHAREMGASGREPPFFFMKPADALVAVPAGQEVGWAYPGLTRDLHHEVELVLAIGRGGRDIPVPQAAYHVWGCAVGLDLTRRDLQAAMKREGKPWEIGKAFDGAAPVGALRPVGPGAATAGFEPWLAPRRISLAVNGQLRQDGRTDQMIWSVPEVVAELSRAWTLLPGDLIFTGTPAGVGPLQPGDHVRAEIEGLDPLLLQVLPSAP